MKQYGPQAVDVFFVSSAEVPRLQQEVGAPVYPLYDWMAAAFGVVAVPALVRPDGHELAIQYVKPGGRR